MDGQDGDKDGLGGAEQISSTGGGEIAGKRYIPAKIGIWKDMNAASYKKYEKSFNEFSALTYKDHTNLPTREQFLEFFVARRAMKYCGNTLWSQFSHLNKVC